MQDKQRAGRPTTDFDSSSERSNRRKTENLRNSHDTSELAYATEMSLRATGSFAASTVLKEIVTKSPTRASKYRTAFKKFDESPLSEISSDQALNLMISGKFSKQTYQKIRDLTNKNRLASVYPPYKKVILAKKRCYPSSSNMTLTETEAKVDLQELLDHTSSRLLQLVSVKKTILDLDYSHRFKLIVKWGCDGSRCEQYKQKFANENSSDASVFFTWLVLLQLTAFDDVSHEIVVWENPTPSSTRYCRPIRLQFLKETADSICEEKNVVEKQIESLIPFQTTFDELNVQIKYHLTFTMIDGKVKNAITETTSAMRC